MNSMIDYANMSFDNLLNTELDAELSTERPRLSDGEYLATVQEIKNPRVMTSDRGSSVVLGIVLNVQAPEFQAQFNMREVLRTYDIFLDINENGGIATGTGMNVGLGKFREACGKNAPGQAINACLGSLVKIQIRNEVDKKGNVRDNIRGIAPNT